MISGSGILVESDENPWDNPGRNVCLIGPGECLEDDDTGASVASVSITLRFQSDSDVPNIPVLESPFTTSSEALTCDPDTWTQLDPQDEWTIECTAVPPDAADRWAEPQGNNPGEYIQISNQGDLLCAGQDLDSAFPYEENGGGSIRVGERDHPNQGYTRIEFRDIPTSETEFEFPGPTEESIRLCP